MTGIDGREPRDEDVYETDNYDNDADAIFASDNAVEHELEFADEDESLPWLDSDYDTEEDDVDTLRIIGFALLGLLAIGLIVGGLWWLANRGPDPELVADGSTIEAPEGPIKEKPEDAGGREFEGTGNVAPRVGEGQTSEGRLADGDDTPRPSIDAAGSRNTGGAAGAAAGANASDGERASGSSEGERASGSSSDGERASGSSSSAATSGGGVAVQVGAFQSRERAEKAWKILNGQSSALNGFKYRVVEGQVDGSTVYRLQAMAGDSGAAQRLCSALKADGLACQVKR